MDFVWFNDLGYLAQTGNFSQAAVLSNISQPAFSRRIKALESWVGTSLVNRSTHPVVLTAAGQQMLEASTQALARIEQERAQIREAAALPDKYVVTFGAQHSIGWRFYPAWLQAFETAYGPVMTRLRADDLPRCVSALENDDVDFIIAYARRGAKDMSDMRSFESIVIGDDVLIPVCKGDPDQQPLYRFDGNSTAQIPYLRFGPTAPISQHIDLLLDKIDLNDRLNIVYQNTMAGALRIRARDGAGVAWLPKSLVNPDIETGQLAITGLPQWKIPLQIRLYRVVTQSNRLTRDIWSFLVTHEQTPLLETD